MPIELPYNFQNLDTSGLQNATDSGGDVIGKALPANYLDANFQQLAKVVHVGSTPPDAPYQGIVWLDTTNGVIKQYDGTQWVSKVSVANSATNATNATNADKVDGYHASQTPTANTIPVAGADGKLASGWFAISIKGFENPIDTVAYYNQTGNDYPLAVGEVAKITFSSTQNVPLRIATQSNTEYMMWIVPSNTGGTSGGINDYVLLNPNNTTYSNAFIVADVGRNAVDIFSYYTTLSAFFLGSTIIHGFYVIRNLTVYKGIIGFLDKYGTTNTYPNYFGLSCDWRDTTTQWTSLGTVEFPQNSSGYVLVQRIL
ncbi:MAG: hypothetical protein QXV73_03910 [Candidatus Micrarchaeia archaeon]